MFLLVDKLIRTNILGNFRKISVSYNSALFLQGRWGKDGIKDGPVLKIERRTLIYQKQGRLIFQALSDMYANVNKEAMKWYIYVVNFTFEMRTDSTYFSLRQLAFSCRYCSIYETTFYSWMCWCQAKTRNTKPLS